MLCFIIFVLVAVDLVSFVMCKQMRVYFSHVFEPLYCCSADAALP